MGFAKRVITALVFSLLTAASSFAQLPNGSIVIYNEGYDISLLFNSDYDAQINAAASSHPENIYYNISGTWTEVFSGETAEDFKSWPQIQYNDPDGFTRLYGPQNGSPIQSDLLWSLSGEILIDGPDGDPDSENYMLLKFNKPLAQGDYTSLIDDLGSGQFLSVNNDIVLSNISAVEWSPESPDELVLYVSGAANIPSPATISFKLKGGLIKGQDGSALSQEYLGVSKTVFNSHYGE
ncbi:hypothetical protein SAMN02745945_02794 [Peptoclostridium litorale DSM 5388]|uniref:PEP-CTERM sorting domain-containing protein n=1 Tax=Peptoclostridium litorale DSM 5388 TaxID=1121324 RepID=A0A069RD50_PEPLI|nr:hypothetical protein [Peptoclostridium litorale]KDR94966.1 hypothetical protein CLIT_12c00340 [Peptoclostridium litorale DSM 5388]SIO33703.1 hypothetical protein SAMN02745945_02794 [Peptoclostridium litorale DSM 5388]